jgi:hypothetical protein
MSTRYFGRNTSSTELPKLSNGLTGVTATLRLSTIGLTTRPPCVFRDCVCCLDALSQSIKRYLGKVPHMHRIRNIPTFTRLNCAKVRHLMVELRSCDCHFGGKYCQSEKASERLCHRCCDELDDRRDTRHETTPDFRSIFGLKRLSYASPSDVFRTDSAQPLWPPRVEH